MHQLTWGELKAAVEKRLGEDFKAQADRDAVRIHYFDLIGNGNTPEDIDVRFDEGDLEVVT